MNDAELKKRVRSAADNIYNRDNFISPVGLLLEIGVLTKSDYERWRMGRVPYLEQVCNVNLRKLSLIMAELRYIAVERKLRPSTTAYKKWGKGIKGDLRFSKSGDPKIELAYKTHYIGLKLIKEKVENIDADAIGNIKKI